MKITVGSKNPVKIQAVEEITAQYKILEYAEIVSCEVSSEVAPQPKSLEEIIRGAQNRARNAFKNCDYSFGIEGGLMPVPYTKTGYMNICACAIYDGKKYHLGLSSAFEHPKETTRLMIEKGLDAEQAMHKAGHTKNPRIGSSEGSVGILTRGALTRKDYTKEAIRMALIHLENPSRYE